MFNIRFKYIYNNILCLYAYSLSINVNEVYGDEKKNSLLRDVVFYGKRRGSDETEIQ